MVKKSRKNKNNKNNKSSKSYIRCNKYPLKVSRRSHKNYKKSKCVGKKKLYDVPRLYSRKECQGKIKGFTMRSSCAAFKN